MALRWLTEKSADADLLREMIGFAAQRLMELEATGLTGAAHGEKSAERTPAWIWRGETTPSSTLPWSGSTLLAADAIERICGGVQLDPVYVDLAIQRYETATGRKARLAETRTALRDVAARDSGPGGSSPA